MVIINMLYKKIVHVILLCKEMPPTRHLNRNEWSEWSGEISIIVCLQTIIFLKEIKIYFFYVSTIHLLLLKQKYEIFTVDCTQIKDLNNLCVRPTFVCKQTKLGLDWLHFAMLRFARDDVHREIFV